MSVHPFSIPVDRRVKARAVRAVNAAIARGRLVRPDACSRCAAGQRAGSSRATIQAHHDDYSQPLAVVWLCPPCHQARHAEMRGEQKAYQFGAAHDESVRRELTAEESCR